MFGVEIDDLKEVVELKRKAQKFLIEIRKIDQEQVPVRERQAKHKTLARKKSLLKGRLRTLATKIEAATNPELAAKLEARRQKGMERKRNSRLTLKEKSVTDPAAFLKLKDQKDKKQKREKRKRHTKANQKAYKKKANKKHRDMQAKNLEDCNTVVEACDLIDHDSKRMMYENNKLWKQMQKDLDD